MTIYKKRNAIFFKLIDKEITHSKSMY